MQSDAINRNDETERASRQAQAGRLIRPKMDLAKAMSMLGFTSTRSLDQSGGKDAILELNVALSKRMEQFEKKKRITIEKQKENRKLSEKEKKLAVDKIRDDIRTLHEAYQFLSRKYRKRMEQRGNHIDSEDEMEDDGDFDPAMYEVVDAHGEVFIDYRKIMDEEEEMPETKNKKAAHK